MASFRLGRQLRPLTALLVSTLALFAACSSSEGASRLPAEAHVHGIGVNPADGRIYLGTHGGLFRLDAEARKVAAVGDVRDDFMAFTVLGPDWFIASGHPSSPGRTSNLGLIESRDGGRTWREIALAGQADFHALRAGEAGLFGYHSGGLLVTSSDGGKTWRSLAETEASDFVLDGGALVVATPRGLSRTQDGGRTWTSLSGPRIAFLSGPIEGTLWGLTADGAAFRSSDGGIEWERRGSVTARPAAFLAHDDALYVATVEGEVLRSSDGGASWQRLLG